MFDLITVAQAIHWFDFDRFYDEVKRTAKQHAIICVVGYGLLQISESIDRVITDFYTQVIGPYWDAERRFIDEHYKTIPFPFNELISPDFISTHFWTLQHVIAYINTWSAVKHFEKQNGYNPTQTLLQQIEPLWGQQAVLPVQFPLLLRIGRVN